MVQQRQRFPLQYQWQCLHWQATAELSSSELEELADFHCRLFAERSRDKYLAGLRKTQTMWRVREADKSLAGFGTLNLVDVRVDGSNHLGLYTGWAGLARHLRGRGIIQLAGLWATAEQRLRYPNHKLYWMFTASTYTSYLLMTNNFLEYYPRIDRETPPHIEHLLRAVADQLNMPLTAGGYIIKRDSEVLYREGVVAKDPTVTANPHIRAYSQLNPRQDRGDTLLCAVPLDTKNTAYMINRAFARVMKRACGAARR